MTPIELLAKELAKYERALKKSTDFVLSGEITLEKHNQHRTNLEPKIKEYAQAIFLLKTN